MPAPTTPGSMERKLTAILSADVKGYSRLMGDDEEATIRTLTAYRQLMAMLIQQHRGRVVDSPGDNLLAEFASVVDAVRGAVEIQRVLQGKNAELPPERRMEFRIGLNSGDVIVEGERIYGDGVNIAARLEGLAEPGGICLSGIVYEQVKTKLALSYEYLGEQTVKNIVEPVRVWRIKTEPEVVSSAGEAGSSTFKVQRSRFKGESRPHRRVGSAARLTQAALVLVGLLLVGGLVTLRYPSLPTFRIPQSTIRNQGEETSPLPLPDKPSIAVLPFTNLSGDPGQEHWSDGMTDTLITDLSKLAGLFVIARNSTFGYKGKAITPQQVSQELGVRYLLEGSVQKADARVRINAQLVDATTGHHVWAERYDRDLKDIFALQDDITQKVVAALEVKLTAGEEEQVWRRYTDNVEAYDYYLRGDEYLERFTHEANEQARRMFEKALALDPEFARAYALLGVTYEREWGMQWSWDPHTLEQAFTLAQKALTLDDSLPVARLVLGNVYQLKKQPEQAIAEFEQAIALDPNDADSYVQLADILNGVGRPEEALGLVEKAMRLNPYYPSEYLFHLGWAYASTRRYEEAITAFKRALTRNPDFLPAHLALAAMYSEGGREAEARAEVAEVLRLSPDFSVEVLRQMLPATDQAGWERVLDLLRQAGLQ